MSLKGFCSHVSLIISLLVHFGLIILLFLPPLKKCMYASVFACVCTEAACAMCPETGWGCGILGPGVVSCLTWVCELNSGSWKNNKYSKPPSLLSSTPFCFNHNFPGAVIEPWTLQHVLCHWASFSSSQTCKKYFPIECFKSFKILYLVVFSYQFSSRLRNATILARVLTW